MCILLPSLILNLILLAIFLYYYQKTSHQFKKLTFKESECIDPKSKCVQEINKRFNLYAPNVDDFDISGKNLNMMNVIILPDDNKEIAHYHFASNKSLL